MRHRFSSWTSAAGRSAVCTAMAVILVACGGGTSTPSSTSSGLATQLPMNIGVYDPPNVLTFGMDVTDDLGMFRKNGLAAKLVRAPVLSLPPMFVSGQIDLLCGTGSYFSQIFAGQKILAVAGNGAAQPYTLISKKDITSIQGLKGKTIAVPILNTSSIYLLFAYVLQKNGMKTTDVNFVQIQDQKTYIQGMVAGRIDATMVDPADLVTANAQSSIHVLNANPGKGFPVLPVNECFVKPAYAASHERELNRFVKSFIEGQRVLDTDVKTYTKWLQYHFVGSYTTDQAASLFKTQHDLGWWGVNGALERDWVASSLNYYAGLQTSTPAPVNPDDVFTTKYIKAALDEVGVAPSTTDKATWYKK